MKPTFRWRQHGADWTLYNDRRIVGRVVPDAARPGMWRLKLAGGLSDMVNLSRAKDAARAFAERKIERCRKLAESEEKVVENQGAFSRRSSPVRLKQSPLGDVFGTTSAPQTMR